MQQMDRRTFEMLFNTGLVVLKGFDEDLTWTKDLDGADVNSQGEVTFGVARVRDSVVDRVTGERRNSRNLVN